MAKKVDLEDLDNWDDFDKEFGNMGFDDNTEEPPKNSREVITRSVRDLKKGFISNIRDNKLKTAGKLARNSIPKSLSKEADLAFDIANSVGNEVREGLDEFKKHSRDTLKNLERVLPNGKVKDLVSKIKSKFGEDYESKGTSKAQLEAELISGSINEALGAMQQQQQATEMIRQSIESKRAATTNNLLSHIYAETKFTRVFHAETTNKFYRKSLELQYKSLFVQKETLELQKAAFNGFQKQLETIIHNSALPDVLKARNNELLTKDLKAKIRREMIDSLYGRFDPLENMKKNLVTSIKDFREGLTGVFDTVNMGLDGYSEMRDNNEMMGISGAYNLGSMLSDFASNKIGGAIGRRIAKTKIGRNAIYNTKNAFADPYSFLKKMSKSKYGGSAFGAMSTLIGANPLNNPDYIKRDLDLATPFDGRAHDSLVKVIPGLLSKIHGEIQHIRTKVSPGAGPNTDNELIWDVSSESLIKKGNVKTKLNKEMEYAINDRVKPLIKHLLNIYMSAGANISGKSAEIFTSAIIKYMLERRSGLSIEALTSSTFLANINDRSTLNKLKSANKKLIEYCKINPDQLDEVNTILKYIKESIPSMNTRFSNFYKQGNSDILTGMGVANLDISGNLRHNANSANEFLLSSLNYKLNGVKSFENNTSVQTEKIIKNVKNKVKTAYGSTKTYVGEVYSETKDFLNKVDKDTAVNYVMSNKAKLKDFVSDEVSPFLKKKINKAHKLIRVLYRKSLKSANDYLEKNPKAKEVIKMVSELKEEASEYVTEAYNDKIDNEKLEIHKENIKQISNNIIKYTTGKKEQLVENIKRVSKNDALVKNAFKKMREWDRDIVKNIPGMTNDTLSGISSVVGFTGDVLGKLKPSRIIGYDGVDAQEVSYDDAKAEYMNSPEYKDGSAPTFPGWLKTMKYKVKDNRRRVAVKNAFKKMREWDRFLAGKMMKGIFKTPGLAFKAGKGILGVGAKAVGGTANVMLDMLPLGLGEVIKTPFALMNKTLELAGLKENQDSKKERAGSWLSRLNLFKRDKEVKERKGFLGRLTTAMKENKGLTTIAILGGISALLKTMGLSLTDVVDGVKKVGSILVKGFTFVSNLLGSAFGFVGKGIDKVKNFFGFGNDGDNESSGGDSSAEGWGKTLGTATAAGAGLFGASKFMKLAKLPGGGLITTAGKVLMTPGRIIVNAMWSLAKKLFSWGPVNAIPGFVEKLFKGKNGDVTAKKLDKIIPTKEKVINSFKKVESQAVKKLGKKALGKGIAKIGLRIAAGLSGVGTLVALGFLAWDLAWIVKYMLIDGMSFLGAISMQYFGTNIMDNEDTDSEMSPSYYETDVGHTTITNETPPNQTGSSGIMSSISQAYNTYNTSRSFGNSIGTSMSMAYDQFTGAMSSSSEKGPYGYSGKPFKNITDADIAKLKIDSPNVNKSPFITPDPQSTDNNKPADIEGLDPELKKRLYAFAEDYYRWTGKKLRVTSARRRLEQQVKLWEQDSKVKWTGDRIKDRNAMIAAGGKDFGHGRGSAAYPSPTSAHVIGTGVDLNISKMPGESSINYHKPTPWLDNLLAKHGLKRSLTYFNKPNVSSPERWHVSSTGAPVPENETPPETKGLTRDEVSLLKDDVTGNNSPGGSLPSFGGGSSADAMQISSPSSGGSTSSAGGGSSSSGFMPSTASYSDNTTSLASNRSSISSNIDSLLQSQLNVQTNTRDLVKEIRDYMLSGRTNSASGNTNAPSTMLPEPKIDLKRKYTTI